MNSKRLLFVGFIVSMVTLSGCAIQPYGTYAYTGYYVTQDEQPYFSQPLYDQYLFWDYYPQLYYQYYPAPPPPLPAGMPPLPPPPPGAPPPPGRFFHHFGMQRPFIHPLNLPPQRAFLPGRPPSVPQFSPRGGPHPGSNINLHGPGGRPRHPFPRRLHAGDQ